MKISKLQHYKEDLLMALRYKIKLSKKRMGELEKIASQNTKTGLTECENQEYNWHKKRITITINLILKLEHYEYE